MLKKAVFLLGNMKIPLKCSRGLLNEKIRSLNKLIPFKFVYIALFSMLHWLRVAQQGKKRNKTKIYIFNITYGLDRIHDITAHLNCHYRKILHLQS